MNLRPLVTGLLISLAAGAATPARAADVSRTYDVVGWTVKLESLDPANPEDISRGAALVFTRNPGNSSCDVEDRNSNRATLAVISIGEFEIRKFIDGNGRRILLTPDDLADLPSFSDLKEALSITMLRNVMGRPRCRETRDFGGPSSSTSEVRPAPAPAPASDSARAN